MCCFGGGGENIFSVLSVIILQPVFFFSPPVTFEYSVMWHSPCEILFRFYFKVSFDVFINCVVVVVVHNERETQIVWGRGVVEAG